MEKSRIDKYREMLNRQSLPTVNFTLGLVMMLVVPSVYYLITSADEYNFRKLK